MWTLDDPAIKNATVTDAHALLLKTVAPEPIKHYVRMGIAALAMIHGNDVRVTVNGSGHLCHHHDESDDITSATIEVSRGDVPPAEAKADEPPAAAQATKEAAQAALPAKEPAAPAPTEAEIAATEAAKANAVQ